MEELSGFLEPKSYRCAVGHLFTATERDFAAFINGPHCLKVLESCEDVGCDQKHRLAHMGRYCREPVEVVDDDRR